MNTSKLQSFNDQEWLISMVKKSKSTQDVQALISDDQNDDVKRAFKSIIVYVEFHQDN